MSNYISPELAVQISDEAKERAEGWADRMNSDIAKSEYYIGASSYALKWEQAELLIEKMAKALDEIKGHIFVLSEPIGFNVLPKIEKAMNDYNNYKKGKYGNGEKAAGSL